MGNYVSCTLTVPLSAKLTKVILPNGEIRRFSRPVSAAELMLESPPNHFVADAKSLQIGRRFCALCADEDLEIAGVYALFPMKRLCSIVTASDVGVLFLAANRAAAGDRRRVVSDESGGSDHGEDETPKLDLEEIEDLTAPGFKLRLSMCRRSTKPMLETIVEESRITLGEMIRLE
ncbi:unnamed protein product [Cuscuta campestris]|uniref:Uncharacterized protein n=1 Tax=Cuscuta campestris TaxID=132261 RepID=A0A484NIX4_9ASTE|nr:unnamed protein product [Cuscuta campestris]